MRESCDLSAGWPWSPAAPAAWAGHGRPLRGRGHAGGAGRRRGDRCSTPGRRPSWPTDGLDVAGCSTDVPTSTRWWPCATRPTSGSGPSTCCATTPGSARAAEGHLWDHELNDWRWALAVNVWGVIHGIKAFVPAMIEGGEPGHVVNTSSGNGGVSPMPGTPIYALDQGRGGHHHRVPLRPAAVGGRAHRRLGAVPGTAHAAHRSVHLVAQPAARVREPRSPAPRPRRASRPCEARMAAAGMPLELHPGRGGGRPGGRRHRADRFWILPEPIRPTPRSGPGPSRCWIAPNPTYLRDVPDTPPRTETERY